MESIDFRQHLDTLVHWANKKNYHVAFVKNGDDAVCDVSKIIEINSSLSLQTQLFRLLHECGHVLVFENGSFFEFEKKRHYAEKTQAYQVFTVIEEIEAWKRGRELANRLKIEVSEELWEKAMVSALKKYIDWAATGVTDENQS